jgi:two-component system CheB/CheR fusion protein
MLLRPGTLDLADPDHDGAGASTDSSQVVETGTFGSAISIFIVDDDRAIRDLLRALFEGAGYLVEDYRDCEAFLAAYDAGRRGCLLVDGYLPGMSGLDLLRHLGARKSGLPVIMITGHSDVPIAVQAMKAGASDFIAKPIRPNELLASVARALEQTRDVAPIPTGHEAALECLAALTSRQREVLDRILAGQPNKIIAADLGISQRTVERHRWSIMKRTGSNSLPALSRLAFVAAAGRVRSST